MGYLMSQYNCKTRLILCIREQAFVNNNLTARHTEGVSLLVLDKIKLPLEVVYLVGVTIIAQVSLHSIGKIAPYTLNHSRILCIGRLPC